MIYFDNAATTFPKPMAVKTASETFFNKYGGNPGRGGHTLSIETAKQIYETREAVKNLFNAESEEDVVFTQNCTNSTNIVINGLLKQGDHVIISDMEHNSVSRPVDRLAREGIITYDIAKTYDDDLKTLQSFKSLIKPNTRLIITIHASNILANVVPIELIGNLCNQNNIFFMVDAAQSAGIINIDVQKQNIDFLCVAAHKGLYSATGMGILVTDKGELLRPLMVGGTGSQSSSQMQPDFMPDRLESGTGNTLGIITLKAGIDFLNKQGINKLYEKELILAKNLYDGLSAISKVTLYSAYPEPDKAVPVVAFNVEGYTSEEICAYLNNKEICLRAGLHCAPLAHQKANTLELGMARASFGAFNNANEVKKLVNYIKNS
ncbi:MAG: aminotransferase class V-fold PLP-dependent enzyme [Oscillospiraceae bacterium]